MAGQSYSVSGSQNTAQSRSATNGTAASQRAIATTGAANASAYNAWKEAAEYNAEQARIQREWQERMANTVYQRTVNDMKKAGINPVLAAGMGIGTASVGGGSAASISPSQVYNAQTFADSMSASDSYGSSYSKSENGLITLANALSSIGQGLIEGLSSSQQINIAIDGLKTMLNEDETTDKKTGEKTKYDKGATGLLEKAINWVGGSVDSFKDFWNTSESKEMKYMKQRLSKDKQNYYGNTFQYHNNGW